ncbi:MAG: ABC transporter permease [Nitrospirae bacterium]|nr:MAG: ABC transporter permease [Nitrospirota bacterium]
MATAGKASYKYLRTIEYLYELFSLLFAAFGNLPFLKIRPVRTVFFRQIYFGGIETFGKVIIIGLLIGIVIITQITSLVGLGSAVLTGKILIWVVVRELGPLLAAIIIIARSATAIASELGAMNIENEIENIELMGIDPNRYLIMPRVFALALSAVVLTFYFELAAIFGGIAVTSIFWAVPFEQYSKGMLSSLSIAELSVSLLKSLLFGTAIAAVSCSQGLKVRKSITQIPQATTRATIQSLFLVFIFDGIITFIFFV